MLFAARLVQQDFVLFHTKSGILRARQVAQSEPSESDPPPPGPPGGAPGGTPGGAPGGGPAMSAQRRPVGRGRYELDFPMEAVEESGEEERGRVREALGGVEVGFVGRSSLDDVLVRPSLSPSHTRLPITSSDGVRQAADTCYTCIHIRVYTHVYTYQCRARAKSTRGGDASRGVLGDLT